MNKLKLIPLLYLLLILIIGAVLSVASAQTAPSMSTAIQEGDFVPRQDVYCNDNYHSSLDVSNYPCPRVPASGNFSAIPAGVVDWVLLELRAVIGSSTDVREALVTTIVARKPAFLLSNGRVVDAEEYVDETSNQDPTACTGLNKHANCPDVEFNEGDFNEGGIARAIDGKELYLVIRHRNHVDVISSTRLVEDSDTAGLYAYDFTSANTSALGGASALVEKSGTYAMYGGDADRNGNVNLSDYNNGLRDDARTGQGGYLDSDVDMNSNANLSDYNDIIRDNARASRGTQITF